MTSLEGDCPGDDGKAGCDEHWPAQSVSFCSKADPRYQWVEIDNLGNVALPTVMRKVLEHGLGKLR